MTACTAPSLALGERHDAVGGVLEEPGLGGIDAALLLAGHGMAADEVDPCGSSSAAHLRTSSLELPVSVTMRSLRGEARSPGRCGGFA